MQPSYTLNQSNLKGKHISIRVNFKEKKKKKH